MSLDKALLDKFITVTEKAAYGASLHIGKGDKIAADQGAVDPMRNELNKMPIKGTIVIGEGEMDDAPMLYIGERVGKNNGPDLDIALDPLEGTNFVAKNLPNALSVMAIAEKGNLLSAPDTYMEKISIGSNLPKNLLDLDNTIEKNIKLLAEAKNTVPENLTACILDRPRHKKIITELKKLNVKINFISDGDVAGAMYVIDRDSPVDIYLGIGGGPEGVLAAAALACYGGQIQTRLVLDDKEKKRATNLGINDFTKKYNIDDIIKGDVMFVATGVTSGDLLEGIIEDKDTFKSFSLGLHKASNTQKKVSNIHKK